MKGNVYMRVTHLSVKYSWEFVYYISMSTFGRIGVFAFLVHESDSFVSWR